MKDSLTFPIQILAMKCEDLRIPVPGGLGIPNKASFFAWDGGYYSSSSPGSLTRIVAGMPWDLHVDELLVVVGAGQIVAHEVEGVSLARPSRFGSNSSEDMEKFAGSLMTRFEDHKSSRILERNFLIHHRHGITELELKRMGLEDLSMWKIPTIKFVQANVVISRVD